MTAIPSLETPLLACEAARVAAEAAGVEVRLLGDDLEAEALGLEPRDHLSRNDAYTFFHALDRLIVTGPTRTNVNDFRAILVLPRTP